MAMTIKITLDKEGQATNGNVIEAIFPKAKISTASFNSVKVEVDGQKMIFGRTWWDTPYFQSNYDGLESADERLLNSDWGEMEVQE